MKIFFSHSYASDPFSKLIQWATKSQWTHCGFILDPTLGGETMVAESAWDHGGANVGFWFTHQFQAFEIYEFESLESQQIDFLKRSVGVKYSYAKVILYGISALLGEAVMKKCASYLSVFFKDPWADGMWCSEYCNSYFQTGSSNLLGIDADPEVVTPEILYQAVKSNPNFKLIRSN